MHSKYEDAFLIGNIEVTNKKEIANGFNSFFANITVIYVLAHTINIHLINSLKKVSAFTQTGEQTEPHVD